MYVYIYVYVCVCLYDFLYDGMFVNVYTSMLFTSYFYFSLSIIVNKKIYRFFFTMVKINILQRKMLRSSKLLIVVWVGKKRVTRNLLRASCESKKILETYCCCFYYGIYTPRPFF